MPSIISNEIKIDFLVSMVVKAICKKHFVLKGFHLEVKSGYYIITNQPKGLNIIFINGRLNYISGYKGIYEIIRGTSYIKCSNFEM